MAKSLILNRQTGIPFRLSLISDLLMMHVKVKAKDIRFTIPVPYAILNIVISILSSKLLQKYANKWTKEYFERKKTGLYLSTHRQTNANTYCQGTPKL